MFCIDTCGFVPYIHFERLDITLLKEKQPMELTPRRLQICRFIAQFVAEHGYAPTIREIGHGVGLASTSVVFNQLGALERAGALRRTYGYSRTIVLTPRAHAALRGQATRGHKARAGAAAYAI
jgi:SOS-response transcriptional repressor LexA